MNIEAVSPLTLPSLSLQERRNLPNCPAVYFVLDGDSVLYIGRSSNLAQRWVNHHRQYQLASISNNLRIAWLECSDSTLLPEIEAALIKHFQPALNQTVITDPVQYRFTATVPKHVYEWITNTANKQGRKGSNLASFLLTRATEEEIAQEGGTERNADKEDAA